MEQYITYNDALKSLKSLESRSYERILLVLNIKYKYSE